jgi:hypothetical protein
MVELEFRGAMTNTSDKELIDFLIECRKTNMSGWLSRLCHYANLSTELEFFELTSLSFKYIGSGGSIENIALQFHYQGLQHVYRA